MNTNFLKFKPSSTPLKATRWVKFASQLTGMGLLMSGTSHGAVAVWQYEVLFNEFAGQPGGFEAPAQAGGTVVYNSRNSGTTAANTRSYDFLKPSGTSAGGNSIYGVGQDGNNDLTVTSRIIDNSNGHWTNLIADKTSEGLRSSAFVANGKSKAGDYGVIAYEFSFSPELGITAKDLAVRLSNVNGIGEIYEWSFVTLGTAADAPFNAADIANYRNTTYTNVSSGVYYNADGTPSGAAATGNALANGKSISQFLAGQPGQSPAGGLVDVGWYANDDFHVNFTDGPEATFTNPTAGSPDKPDTLSITGADLGLVDEFQIITDFTVWLGYIDVGFDSNGDGFTSTGSTQRGMISSVTIGASEPPPVPEPSTSIFAALVGMSWVLRRKRR